MGKINVLRKACVFLLSELFFISLLLEFLIVQRKLNINIQLPDSGSKGYDYTSFTDPSQALFYKNVF